MADDIRLICETSKLEKVWRECTQCRGTCWVLWEKDGTASPLATCGTCHGMGKVAFIDSTNILDVEAWFWKSKYSAVQFDNCGPRNAMRGNLVRNQSDPAKRVAESVRIIAEAIRVAQRPKKENRNDGAAPN